MTPDLPAFTEFYAGVHERPPFPWQARLADQVLESGSWPKEIGIPTGLGKTTCLDIAIWLLASDADAQPEGRRFPTRIWWVVNRRLLVDATAEHAAALAKLFSDPPPSSAVAAVARRLSLLSLDGRPLDVVKLRGGTAIGRPKNPSQPTVVLSTVPMYGSRLLFRGYGSSRSMRPIDAALAGTDSLVLADEAHLCGHLINLFDAVEACDPACEHPLPVTRRRPIVVSLTATGGAAETPRFDLNDDDLANPVVVERISAPKPVRMMLLKDDEALASEVMELLRSREGPTSCVVFVNTPASARRVFDLIRGETGKQSALFGADVELLTGRVREREAATIRTRVITAAGSTATGSLARHFIAVATQTLEVGADLDFECLVTEQCSIRALTQRLGRLNRLGRQPDPAAVYCHIDSKSKSGEWPIYGAEPARVYLALTAAAADGVVDLGPRHLVGVLGVPPDEVGVAPALLPALLWEWVKTTTPPPDEAPVEPYFSGVADPVRRAAVVWRVLLPADDETLWPRVDDREAIDVPLSELRPLFDEGGCFADLGLRRLDAERRTLETTTPSALRPGDTVLLPTDAGGYDGFGWAPGSDEPVADVSVLRAGVPVEAAALQRLFGPTAPGEALIKAALEPDDDCDDDTLAKTIGALIRSILNADPPAFTAGEWDDLRDGLRLELVRPTGEVPRLARAAVSEQIRLDDLDEMSLFAQVHLLAHGEAVGDRARAISERLGLAANYCSIVGRSGSFHDVGKADQRFQRWLDPLTEHSAAIAKSDRPRHRWQSDRMASGWPAGGRHEELSRRLVHEFLKNNPLTDGDLIEHLVVSHHGHGRPLLIPVEDRALASAEFVLEGVRVMADADLSVVDWDQPTRFRQLNERFGFWGLALLETIVRQADHEVSSGSDSSVALS